MWNKESFKAQHTPARKIYIMIKGILSSDCECILINVCAPNDVKSMRNLWMELIQLKNTFQVPWCLGCDFIEIKSMGERSGCLRNGRGIRDYIDFMNEMEVQDLQVVRKWFTWTDFQNNIA